MTGDTISAVSNVSTTIIPRANHTQQSQPGFPHFVKRLSSMNGALVSSGGRSMSVVAHGRGA
ncbi:hypothetical protein BGZ63DRAFT_388172 [Mariannaea sp. PMI_226]|nr:hypothetical protein BGZ63DRAFT_388172 [Mariannaea sp. PMI_226]